MVNSGSGEFWQRVGDIVGVVAAVAGSTATFSLMAKDMASQLQSYVWQQPNYEQIVTNPSTMAAGTVALLGTAKYIHTALRVASEA